MEIRLRFQTIALSKTTRILSSGGLKRFVVSRISMKVFNAQENVVYVVIDETVNYIICEFSKIAQKEFESRHDWAGKVIH